MPISTKRQTAEQLYASGRTLFEQGLYSEALIELHRAEDLLRALEARGHPFTPNPLSNGVSALANTLALAGLCHQNLGDYRAAITYYETSFISAKFEKKKPFQNFSKMVEENLTACYEKIHESLDQKERDRLLNRDPEIDISFRFPYSLSPDVVPLARLFELAPERYSRFRSFYQRSRSKDTEIRRRSKTSDQSTMKRMSVYVWSVLIMIWAVYVFIVIEALVRN